MIETLSTVAREYKHILAFEVSKAKLHVCILPGGEAFEIANERAAVRRVIKQELRRNAKLAIGPLLVACEATGTYSANVIAAAHAAGVDCHRAHGTRVRHFAKFRGTHAKSDPIDVRVIADYALASRDLTLHRPARPEQAELRELVARRAELKVALEAEKARVEHVGSKLVARSLREHIDHLEQLIARLEQRIGHLVAEDEEFARKVRLMQSVKGIGPVTAAAILAYLPEIGTVARGTIAALAGLAPFADDSGESTGRRHIAGGRAEVRTALYMAAIVAIRCNTHLAELAARLEARGRPFKVRVTAVMRKLLVILNAVVASNAPCRTATAGRGGEAAAAK